MKPVKKATGLAYGGAGPGRAILFSGARVAVPTKPKDGFRMDAREYDYVIVGGGIHDQLALAPKLQCPIQFHYGAKDESIPGSAVESVRSAVSDKNAEVLVYEGANHGFNCWDRGTYHPNSAALGHGRALTFLAQHGF